MTGSLVLDLGVESDIWLFLTMFGCVTLFFKFSRIWSVRNLDLLLLFALAPGMMRLVGNGDRQPWIAFVWLFLGSAAWLIRCFLDLGLTRRPLLEPNLNAAGLACLSVGMLSSSSPRQSVCPLMRAKQETPQRLSGRDTPLPQGRVMSTRP